MIGSINGPDALAAVEWLEDLAFPYVDARWALDAHRIAYAGELARFRGGDPPLARPRDRLTDAQREALGVFPGGDVCSQPMIGLIDDVADPSEPARWPVPFAGRVLGEEDDGAVSLSA